VHFFSGTGGAVLAARKNVLMAISSVRCHRDLALSLAPGRRLLFNQVLAFLDQELKAGLKAL
jgi:hypothetical protein